MKKVLYIAIAGIFAFTSCQTDLKPAYETKVTFTAKNESGTRTILNNTSVLWQSTDQITIFNAEGVSAVASAKPYAANTCAKFEVAIQNSSSYYAVNPHSAAARFNDGVITVDIPQNQSGNFADINYAVAKATSDHNLNFKHIAGYIEFTIDKPGVVEIVGAEGDKLAGQVCVTGFDSNLTINSVQNFTNRVSVDVRSSGTYHVALLPDANLKVLNVILTDGTQVSSAFSPNSMKMERGKLYSLGNITDRLIPEGQFGATIEDFVIEEFPYNF